MDQPDTSPVSPAPHRLALGPMLVVLALSAACIVALISTGALERPANGPGTPTQTTVAHSSSAPGSPSDAAAIAARTDPSVVDIDTVIDASNMEGLATGLVISPGGRIVTNNHVIEGETSMAVRDVGNGKTYHGTVVGYDRSADIAVVQLKGASGLKTIARGDSALLRRGDGVVTVGNAGGSGGTPAYAAGAVTALDQSILAADQVTNTSEQLVGLIQTNADVVQGDSGGALVTARGLVVGMTVAGSSGFQFQNLPSEGFAIPLRQVLTVAGGIVNGRSSSVIHVGPTAFLGVATETPMVEQGAEIVAVQSGSPAAKAGLMPGDVVTGLGADQVTSAAALTNLLVATTPGVRVQVHYTDFSGAPAVVTVRLASGPPQ